MITWKKPNGNIMKTNDSQDTIDYLASLGWKQVKKPTKKQAAKKDDNRD